MNSVDGHGGTIKPRRRDDGLVITDCEDEIVVYDLGTHKIHCLSATSAVVWRHCDGETTIDELTAILHEHVSEALGEDVVWLALRQMDEAHLLEERVAAPGERTRYTRRAVLKTAGAMAGGAVLLPVIANIAAPTPALAFFSGSGCCGAACSNSDDCCTGCSTCVSAPGLSNFCF
jgi:hypothetical protein